jgi:hypothetical protein
MRWLLGTFVETAREHAGEVVVIPFELIMVDPGMRRRHDSFVATARASGLPLLVVSDVFLDYRYEDVVVNMFDPHPNELAHRLVARRVADYLATFSLPRNPCEESKGDGEKRMERR